MKACRNFLHFTVISNSFKRILYLGTEWVAGRRSSGLTLAFRAWVPTKEDFQKRVQIQPRRAEATEVSSRGEYGLLAPGRLGTGAAADHRVQADDTQAEQDARGRLGRGT